jgi:hypothetical protein
MAKGDNRAVVGSSGRPLPGMVLESGTKQMRNKLGQYTISPEPKFRGGVQFDMSEMHDRSINADPSSVKK